MADQLSPTQLAIIARYVSQNRDKTMRHIAEQSGYSLGVVSKVRYLHNCRPKEWKEVMRGNLSLERAYRNRQSYSFEY